VYSIRTFLKNFILERKAMETKEDFVLTSLRDRYKDRDWFYSVGYDKFGRPVLYVHYECQETIWEIPDKWEGKQLLVHFASSAPDWKSDYLKKETTSNLSSFTPTTFIEAAKAAQAQGIDTGFVGAMGEEADAIFAALKEKEEAEKERELELSVRALTDEIDRLERICGSNILQDIFYEIQDGKNAVTNLSAKFPEVRTRMQKLYDKYGFDIIYEELDG
jgi:hypothetical protein